MSPALDLFTYATRYPLPADTGYRDRDTSRAAAESMAPTASLLRERCLKALRDHGPATADQVAQRLDLSVLATRPRFTELLHDGRIEDTGQRRANASGRSAKVWGAR